MRRMHLVPIALMCLGSTAVSAADADDTSQTSGQLIFEANCANCHTGGFGGFFTGAPKVGKQKDWESLAPKGVDVLTANTLAGIGKMAPRGECAECTDEEIRAAVVYMLQKSQ